jgi:two-component system sensor histidine kinase YesM
MFLIPLLVPLLVLGSFSALYAQQFIKRDINGNNINLLKQTKENVELILNETDPLNLVYGSNGKITAYLSSILRSQALSEYEILAFDILKSFLSAPANARAYIDSFYVYLPNDNGRFLSSKEGIVDLAHYYDTGWYDSIKGMGPAGSAWTESRYVRQYAFETEPARLITIYQGISGTGGVLVFNIIPRYIENVLQSLYTSPDQCVLIVDESNRIILSDKEPDYLKKMNISQLASSDESFYTVETDGDSYIVSQMKSARYGWTYISLIPQRSLYHLPYKIREITLLLLPVSLAVGLVFAFYFTNMNYKRIAGIVNVIRSAEKGQPLPPVPNRVIDEYGYVMHTVLNSFIHQSHLDMQLSERKYKLKSAQLVALQSQINPHFLFNTLETLNWEAIGLTKKPNQVSRMIEHLSQILRYALSNPKEFSIVHTELEVLRSYLTIQTYRYEGKFDVIWEIDPRARHCQIIRLLLQPIVENSIYHGIKEKETPSLLKIKVRKTKASILISIVDTGLGMDKATLVALRNRLQSDNEEFDGSHIGLYNTSQRIKLTYGSDCGLIVRSKRGYGTAVYLEIPCG